MGSSVDGLVSGLSTTDLISQLMQVEAIPQQKLKAKVTAQQSMQSALQQVNTKMRSLTTAAEALTKADAYTVTKATSSATDAVAISATAGAATGQLTFDVTNLAKAHVMTAQVPSNGPITSTGKVTIAINGAAGVDVAIAADKNTPQGLVDAINAAGLEVKAAVVNTGSGTIVQLTATKTGTANDFTIAGLIDGNGDPLAAQIATGAEDAEIRVGGNNPGAYTATSTSNTFTNLMSGVTLTVAKEQTGITVGVTRDIGGIADKVKAMVDATNAVLADISLKTDSKTASAPLKANALVRQASSALVSAVAGGQAVTTNGVTTYSSFSAVGVQTDKSGRLTFDKEKFLAAYAKDPAAVQAMVQNALAPAVKTVADGASNSTTGTITQIVSSGDAYMRRLNDNISDWDVRLATRKNALQRQFGNLETSLSKLKNQSSWLSGQIAGLG